MTSPLPVPLAMPPCVIEEWVNEDVHVLFWVHTGAVSGTAAETSYRIGRGQALWVPARTPRGSRTDAGSVVSRVLVPERSTVELPDQPTVVTVPDSWTDWLIHLFSLETIDVETEGLLAPTHDNAPMSPDRPADVDLPMPRSPAALDVARALRRNPALNATAAEWASRVGVSLRTLHAHFADETGMAFGAWRTRNKVLAAADLLGAGYDVTRTAHQVGYDTLGGLTRAFSAQFGMTPSQFVRSIGGAGTPDRPGSPRAKRAQATTRIGELLSGTAGDPPPVPASGPYKRVYDVHAVWWAYRGTVRIRTDKHTWTLRTGDVIFLPAGVPMTIWLDEGATLLPLGEQVGIAPRDEADVAVLSLGEEHELQLLYTSIASYTLARPPDHDRAAVTRYFDAFAAHRRQRTLTMPAMADARRVALAINNDPGDRRDLTAWAAELGADVGALHAAFVAETGTPFDRWRAHLRMQMARELLADGVPVKVVARKLGYSNVSTFSHVFHRAHGVGPREYVRRDCGA